MAELIRLTHFDYSSRFTTSPQSDGKWYNINFTKEQSGTTLIIEGVVPTKENYNDGAYLYSRIDSSVKYTGLIETPMDSNQSQQTLVRQTWTGVSAGNKVFEFRWAAADGGANNPWVVTHPNSSDEGRTQTTGSQWLIWEITP